MRTTSLPPHICSTRAACFGSAAEQRHCVHFTWLVASPAKQGSQKKRKRRTPLMAMLRGPWLLLRRCCVLLVPQSGGRRVTPTPPPHAVLTNRRRTRALRTAQRLMSSFTQTFLEH